MNHSRKKTARLAGWSYFAIAIFAIISLMYVPDKLIVSEDADTTFNNIQKSQSLYRFGILSSVLYQLAYIALVLLLYQLLKPVHKTYAVIMLVLVLVSVPVSFVNIQHKVEVLSLLNQPDYLQFLTKEQIQGQIMSALAAYDQGIQLVQLFWGLWLFPFGYLVYRSGFLPKTLGLLLMLGCGSYLIEFSGTLLIPLSYEASGLSSMVMLPAHFGELGICLWLLIMGDKKDSPPLLLLFKTKESQSTFSPHSKQRYF